MTEARNHDQLVIHIKETLASAKPPFTTQCCIYRVPSEIRKLKEDAYTPKVISIGPLHYGDKKLQNIESLKQIYCQKFIERVETHTSLESLVSCIQKLEPKVRLCYSENIELDAEAFVKLILVDCGFIFEFFTRDTIHDWIDDHGIGLKPWLRCCILLDLLLLENQIPFVALEEIYSLAFPSRGIHSSFLKLTFQFFGYYNRQNLEPTFSIEHFTDLFRTFHLPHGKQLSRTPQLVKHLPSATELSEAGIKFKVNKSNCLLDLEFSGRYLEIPELNVDDLTEIVFRNMVALEQCHYPDKSYITDYVVVLDFLINTGNDVEVLVQNEIIGHWIGDNNAVAELCNGLWKNITQINFNSDYLDICDRLNAYCKHPWHRTKATLRRDYCKTPWQMVASVAGIILLVLTIIQAVCSILQVK